MFFRLDVGQLRPSLQAVGKADKTKTTWAIVVEIFSGQYLWRKIRSLHALESK